MLYPLFPLHLGVMDLPRVGPALLSALQRTASLMQLGQHFNRDITCVLLRVRYPAINEMIEMKYVRCEITIHR